jgi:hypothetical protein
VTEPTAISFLREQRDANPYGFDWGPMSVERCMEHEGRRCVRIHTPYGAVNVYVSPTGRSIRVFKGGKELKADG